MTTLSQRTFAGGELSPALSARSETGKYQSGAKIIRNMYVMKHGGLTNRPGTTFVAEVKDSTKATRLIKFAFSSDQTYALEFGDKYMRIHRKGEQLVESAKTITGISTASLAVVTSTAHGYSTGDEIYLSGIKGQNLLNGRNVKVTVVNANSFSITSLTGTFINTTGMPPYSSGGTAERVYTIATPYAEADLFKLNFVQSADVIIIVHPSYEPQKLSRLATLVWTIDPLVFLPSIPAPYSYNNTHAAGSESYNYVTTIVDKITGEESLPSAPFTISSSAAPTLSAPIVIYLRSNVAPPSGQSAQFVVYKELNGIYGFLGFAESPVNSTDATFKDVGASQNTTDTPPSDKNPFGGVGKYPSTVTFVQQRLAMGGSNLEPEKMYLSRTGFFYNFTTSTPIKDDDSVAFTMAGSQVNRVKHMVDVGLPLVLTSGGEFGILGDSSGVIKPTAVNPRQYTYNGSSDVPPIVVGNTALYIQARGSIVRDLAFSQESDGYRGNDLTIFATHLFEGYSIKDWCYQQNPHSIVWCVRNDGILLGFTYLKEQEIWAWHKHDTDGIVESIISIPEGDVDAVYMIVNRFINGAYRRYVERLSERYIPNVIDSKFMDSNLTYDGRNTNPAHQMHLTGSGWTYQDSITITSDLSYFSSTDIGNEIHLYSSGTDFVRLNIISYTSATVVVARPDKTVPFQFRNIPTNNWARAVDELSGLHHLEGKLVSVFADGFVVSNPNNPTYDIRQVLNGQVALDKCYALIHVGLPYISDLLTLDLDNPQGETLTDKKMLINKVTMKVQDSRGVFAGTSVPKDSVNLPLDGLVELKARSSERNDEPIRLKSGPIDLPVPSNWTSGGNVFIRQVDPLPLTILSIYPTGYIPGGGR